MACFIVSAAEAIVVTAVKKRVEKKEVREKDLAENTSESEIKIPLSVKLKWLTYMLAGGSVLLLFEHIWHGEIVPWFPFLTAMADAADAAEMLREMVTVGVVMAVLITITWVVMCLVADSIVRRPVDNATQSTLS